MGMRVRRGWLALGHLTPTTPPPSIAPCPSSCSHPQVVQARLHLIAPSSPLLLHLLIGSIWDEPAIWPYSIHRRLDYGSDHIWGLSGSTLQVSVRVITGLIEHLTPSKCWHKAHLLLG